MWHLGNFGEDAGVDRLSGKCLKRGRPHEAQRGFGGDYADLMTGLGELTNNGARLVGGDATGDADNDPLAIHYAGSSLRQRLPRTITARPAPVLLLALGVFEQIGVDLAHGDGQRLFLQPGLDQRTNVFEDALAELVVVVVDLPGPLGRVDHQGVFARDTVQQFIDGWVGDAERGVVSALSTCRRIE